MDTKPIENEISRLVAWLFILGSVILGIAAWPAYKFVHEMIIYVAAIHSTGQLP